MLSAPVGSYVSTRLVAKGFIQIYGVDFYETYAPVARLASFRLLLTVTAHNDWPVNTFDFDSAYLNSILNDDNEIIYLEQLLRLSRSSKEDQVSRSLLSSTS